MKVNRVPAVSAFFWVIKCLATALGETIADLVTNGPFNGDMNHSLALFGCILFVLMCCQFYVAKYMPLIYWLSIITISIVGTLITDLLAGINVPLDTLCGVFAAALFLSFAGWYYSEGTLSIHTIYTPRRELWYWLTVLATFCLGTATGDKVSEEYAIGYWRTLCIVCGIIGIDFIVYLSAERMYPTDPENPEKGAWRSVLAFWIAYVLTRPLGASVGDLLTQPPAPYYTDICGPFESPFYNISTFDCQGDNPCISGEFDGGCPVQNAAWNQSCPKGNMTCYADLACPDCWGIEAGSTPTIVFAVAAGLIIVYMTFTNLKYGAKG